MSDLGRSFEASRSWNGARRPGIVDVAKLAGVSRQTVSNVLNENEGYTQLTKAKVLAAVQALGYQRNLAASSLRSRRTMQLAYHVHDQHLNPENPFMVEFLQALIAATRIRKYHIAVFAAGENELDDFRGLIHNADGFIFSELAVNDPRPRFLAEQGIAFASFGRISSDLPQNWVDIDNADGTATLVDYLVSRGHERIGYVGYRNAEYWTTERHDGYLAGLERNGIRAAQNLSVEVTPEVREAAIRRLLTRSRPPTAIMAGSDALAITVVNIAKSLGLRVGHDIAVTGFGGGIMQRTTEPVLTTARIPIELVASALVDRCLDVFTDGPTDQPGLVLPVELSQGGTA